MLACGGHVVGRLPVSRTALPGFWFVTAAAGGIVEVRRGGGGSDLEVGQLATQIQS